MRIPDVEGLKTAHEAVNASAIVIPDARLSESEKDVPNDIARDEVHHRHLNHPQSFGRAAAVLSAANGTAWSAPAEKQQLNERQSTCPSGKAFYACANGFTGCCAVNPCDSGTTCPDGSKAGDEGSQTKGQEGGGMASPASTAEGVSEGVGGRDIKTETVTRARTASSGSQATATTGIRTASATGTLASTTRAPRPTGTAAPNCPRANGKTYTDSFEIPYRIRCNSDQTSLSFDTIAVGTGGYDQCFSSCSQSAKCAGFTFVGMDTGNCYLKTEMGNSTYEAKGKGSGYTSCAKVDPGQSAGTDPAGMKPAARSSKAPIIGGVVGGIAFLALLLLIVALCAKRRRKKKIEVKRRGTVTHVFHGPTELDMTAQPTHQTQHLQQEQMPGYGFLQPGQGYAAQPYGYQEGHQRQGSTSHDVYGRGHGGPHRDDTTLAADEQSEGYETTGLPDACGPALVATLSANIYQVPLKASRSVHEASMREGRSSGESRSPRFHEHLAETEGGLPSRPYPSQSPPSSPLIARVSSPTTDSPTLGRQPDFLQPVILADAIRRKQYLEASGRR